MRERRTKLHSNKLKESERRDRVKEIKDTIGNPASLRTAEVKVESVHDWHLYT